MKSHLFGRCFVAVCLLTPVLVSRSYAVDNVDEEVNKIEGFAEQVSNQAKIAEAAKTGDLAATQQAVEEVKVSTTDADEQGNTDNTGGKPGKPDDPPNIYDVPWKSDGIRSYYESLFKGMWDASAFGGSSGFGDREATPE